MGDWYLDGLIRHISPNAIPCQPEVAGHHDGRPSSVVRLELNPAKAAHEIVLSLDHPFITNHISNWDTLVTGGGPQVYL
jgi:hypothetical protein